MNVSKDRALLIIRHCELVQIVYRALQATLAFKASLELGDVQATGQYILLLEDTKSLLKEYAEFCEEHSLTPVPLPNLE